MLLFPNLTVNSHGATRSSRLRPASAKTPANTWRSSAVGMARRVAGASSYAAQEANNESAETALHLKRVIEAAVLRVVEVSMQVAQDAPITHRASRQGGTEEMRLVVHACAAVRCRS